MEKRNELLKEIACNEEKLRDLEAMMEGLETSIMTVDTENVEGIKGLIMFSANVMKKVADLKYENALKRIEILRIKAENIK